MFVSTRRSMALAVVGRMFRNGCWIVERGRVVTSTCVRTAKQRSWLSCEEKLCGIGRMDAALSYLCPRAFLTHMAAHFLGHGSQSCHGQAPGNEGVLCLGG